MTPAKKWKEYFGRELCFNLVQINNKIVYQQVVENIKIKPYFCIYDNSFEVGNYETISSFSPINRGLVKLRDKLLMLFVKLID